MFRTDYFLGRNSLVLLTIGIILVNCGGTPDTNPVVQKAQKSYNKIETDSLVVSNASEELRKAREALQEAHQSMLRGEPQATVEKKALLAQQRIIIAKRKAELEAAHDQLRRMSRELQALQNSAGQTAQNETSISKTEPQDSDYFRRLTQFETEQTKRGLVIRFQSGVFEQSKAYLKSSAAGAINELVDFLQDYPDRTVLIEGHTDNTGSASLNQKLSQQRADAVRNALIARNISADRIRAIGLGEKYPRVSNDTEAGRAYNRRVEVIMSDTSGVIPDRP